MVRGGAGYRGVCGRVWGIKCYITKPGLLRSPLPLCYSYEGLTREDVPHGMGVMVFGNGTGGGFHFRDVRRGDK